MLDRPRNYDKIKNLLKDKFGISEHDDKTSRLFAKLMAAFKKDTRDMILINAELEALTAMRDAALEYAAQHYPLVLDPKTNKPHMTSFWDPETLSWSFEMHISTDAPKHLAGRPLIIKVQSRAANNNFNSSRFKEEIESKFKAAAKFFRDNQLYQKNINAIKQAILPELNIFLAQFDTMLSTNGMSAVVKRANELQAKIVAELCSNIYKAMKKDFDYNPNKDEMLAARAALKRCEVEMLSQVFDPNKPRPVLMHIYYQDDKKHDPLHLRTVLNVNEPISDTSSDLRDEFIDDKPANCFKVTNQSIFIDRGNPTGRGYDYAYRLGKSESFYRSASWTLLQAGSDLDDEDADPDSKDLNIITNSESAATILNDSELLRQQKAMVRKFLVEQYKQQLIRCFSNRRDDGTPDIDFNKPFLIKLSLDTFLSPTWTKKSGENMAQLATLLPGLHKYHRGIDGTFISGNELKQLRAFQACFDAMDDTELLLVRNDAVDELEEFVKDIQAANPTVTRSEIYRIRSLEVRTRLSYFNAPVGRVMPLPLLKTQIPIAWLDWSNANFDYNMAGLRLHRRNIREFIVDKEPNPHKRIAIENLFNESTFDHNKSWQKIRRLFYNGNAEKIRTNLLGDIQDSKAQDEILTVILCYIRIRDYLHKNAPIIHRINPEQFFSNYESEVAKRNDRIANSYMVMAASVCVMNEAMGIANIITCKSGKDRTGIFCILREALIDADNNEMLIENICNAIRYSASQSINAMNVPGCVGIQAPAAILSGLKELFGEKFTGLERIEKLLTEQQSALVGGMGKAAYGSKSKDAIIAITLANPPTDTSAVPMEIPSNVYWPKQYVGPMYRSATVAPPPGLTPIEAHKGLFTPREDDSSTGSQNSSRSSNNTRPTDFPKEYSIAPLIKRFEKELKLKPKTPDPKPKTPAPPPKSKGGGSSKSG